MQEFLGYSVIFTFCLVLFTLLTLENDLDDLLWEKWVKKAAYKYYEENIKSLNKESESEVSSLEKEIK